MCVTYVSCTCTNCTWVVLFDLFISHVQSYWQGWGTHVVHNRSHLLSILKLGFMKGILCILPILYWNRWSPLARLGIRYNLWGGLLPTKSHRRSIQIGVWWLPQYESSNNSHLLLFSLKCLCVANARYDKQSPWFDFFTLTNDIGLSISLSSHLLDRKFSLNQSSSLHGS